MRPVATPDSNLRHPLTAIFGSEAQVRVLRELFLHAGSVSAPHLAARTGVSAPHVRTSLARLVALGAVWRSGQGRSHLYCFAVDHPLAAEIQALFHAETAHFEAIVSSIREAARKAGNRIEAVWLYGSAARGEDRPDSDVDLAVAADDTAGHAVDRFREQVAEAGRRSGYRPSIVRLTPSELRRLAARNDPWWQALTRDAWPILGPTPAALVGATRPRKARSA